MNDPYAWAGWMAIGIAVVLAVSAVLVAVALGGMFVDAVERIGGVLR
jgi:hypothetical protein